MFYDAVQLTRRPASPPVRTRRERPRDRCTAEQRDELAPIHSITSSASASSLSGTVRPSALAVLRLILSANLVGCSTRRVHLSFARRAILQFDQDGFKEG